MGLIFTILIIYMKSRIPYRTVQICLDVIFLRICINKALFCLSGFGCMKRSTCSWNSCMQLCAEKVTKSPCCKIKKNIYLTL